MNYSAIVNLLLCLFFAITFLESAIDKIVNRDGNLSWIQGHFSKTILNNFSTSLFNLLTMQELFVGFLMIASVVGICLNLFDILVPSLLAAMFILIQLFAGQRIAKDYVGASGIIPYIIVVLIGLIIHGFN